MFSGLMKYLGMEGNNNNEETVETADDVPKRRHSTFGDASEKDVCTMSASASDGALVRSADVLDYLTFSDEITYWGRRQLPSMMVQRNQVSVWSILKQSIGKELSKITMPVVFNEPISFLQRIAEYMEYYELLIKAADEPNPIKRLEYVAAFAVSALASNWERVGKPFNPLLGETYELNRLNDAGFRIVCEQVSHHPPVSAFHADGPNFKFYGSIHPKLKFWGQSLEIQPKGVITVELSKFKDVFTWTNVNCSVHNLVMGKLWIEQHGVMEIVSHNSDLRCTLHFKPSSNWFGKEPSNHIEGWIVGSNKNRLRALYGVWTQFLASVDVSTFEKHFGRWGAERKGETASRRRTSSAVEGEDDDKVERRSCMSHVIPVLTGSDVLWRVKHRPADSEQYYHFTSFALLLNELDEERTKSQLPSTDSRLRPDMRCFENGDLDGAADEKNRLEEKQRETRVQMKKDKKEFRPIWFSKIAHHRTKEETWAFNEKYWNRDFTCCADIF